MNKQSYLKARVLNIFFLFSTCPVLSLAQSPESFFPHHVGDRWDYAYWNGGFFEFYSHVITSDSIDSDGVLYLFYNNSNIPKYKIDSSANVSWLFPACTYLLYNLRADSGGVWENQACGDRWAWVARVHAGIIFSRPTVIKEYEYGPVHPDSVPQPYALVKRWLASDFGLIYEWQEPGVFSSLTGCVIAGDTFGTLVSVPPTTEDLPKAFALNQNYPNPFNPSTTIEFELPEAGIVSIRVYDLIGQQVATIAEGPLVAGTHRIGWDSGALSSGVYFCRLQAKGNMHMIKMLLTK